ncbi:coiled-coil domain-containing protein [Actinocorallia populi]|uniref:hypothetical protein n=1 Tax=Actinocorallia populi TaxID=2079200 RepID=UPI001300BEC0|nr:hypothetical protein [Actinocorallia populi]
MSSEELQQRISVEYAPLVALYQLLEDRGREPGSAAAPGPDWNSRLMALRALREGALPGDRDALAGALLDPAHRDVRQVAVVTSPDRLAELVAESVRLGERVLLFGDPARVPGGLLAVDAALRPVGPRWEEELQALRRDLLRLEQWPGDLAALEAAEAETARRQAAAAEEERRLKAELESLRAEREQASAATARAVEEREAAAAAELQAGAVAARCLETFTGARSAADAAARQSAAASSAAGEAARRLAEVEQRLAALRVEAASARQMQGDLGERLERARASLPEVTAEAERISGLAAEAEALRHATYYRLAGAESSLAAERKRQNFAQRLHLAPGRPQLSELRALVASRKLDAEQALARANELNEARQRAEGERAGLTAFLEQGGREMEAAREAQRRLTEELPRLEAELAPLAAEHERLAALAAEAAAEAARAAEPADRARAEGMAAEERLTAARAALSEAEAAVARAREHEPELDRRLAGCEAELERHEAAGAEAVAQARREQEAARETVERHRREIEELLAGEDEEAWRERASARRDLLADAPAEAAQVVCAAPDALPPGEYDVLFVDAAETVTDGDFLLGAVRTRRQVLVGTPEGGAPAAATVLRDLLDALHSLAGTVGTDGLTAGAAAERERLRPGLWEGHYAERHAKIVRRLSGLGLDPVAALERAVAERLETSLYRRCLDAVARPE